MSAHLVGLLGAILFAAASPGAAMPPPEFAGAWHGTAKVTHGVMLDRAFPVRVYIHRDGTVTGTVGNSTLRDARLTRHRPVGVSREERRDLVDYMITGRLVGPVLTAKRVSAREVFIPLDYAEGRFAAAVHAHGTVIAGQPFGIFSADLTLRRSSP